VWAHCLGIFACTHSSPDEAALRKSTCGVETMSLKPRLRMSNRSHAKSFVIITPASSGLECVHAKIHATLVQDVLLVGRKFLAPPVTCELPNLSLDGPDLYIVRLTHQGGEARDVIAGFFKTFPNARNRMDIDPQLMLMRKPDDVKIRTVKRQNWELTGITSRASPPCTTSDGADIFLESLRGSVGLGSITSPSLGGTGGEG
jgi:hypothetical protein